jgi:photosystem II stability/assembly factor-like uncharacterized protein
MIHVSTIPERKWNRSVFALFLLLAACLFETKEVDPSQPGYLSLDLSLKTNSSALLKSASADTIFRLDSVLVTLSSAGQTTTTYRYAVSGRSDSGNISVSPRIYALAALRTWKAVIVSIDTTLNPTRRDTVHRDSVTFSVNPGDTAFVSKIANPIFSILRARFVSNAPASITNNVKWVRIRVDGTARDSMRVGPAFRHVSFGSSTTGYAVGDTGNIIKTTNNGAAWSALTSGTVRNLRGVHFPSANTGYSVGDSGTMIKTTNGAAWTTVTTGTTQNLNATYHSGSTNGWAVGNAGTIIMTTNGTSCFAQASGTSQALNAVHFSNGNSGAAVGGAGTIVRTTDGGDNWAVQASGTSQNLNGVFMTATTVGYAVGDGGTIRKTRDGGANWSARTSGTTANLNEVFFTTATSGYIVGDGGVVLTTSDSGATWTPRSSGTTQNLYGISWTTDDADAVAVGGTGSVVNSADGTSWSPQWIGTKSFDVHLTYKYFTPNVSHSLTMDAIDVESGALRGYQAVKTVLLAPGKDTTVTPNSSLAKCGYGGVFPACEP